jgi:hypothetical protein
LVGGFVCHLRDGLSLVVLPELVPGAAELLRRIAQTLRRLTDLVGQPSRDLLFRLIDDAAR